MVKGLLWGQCRPLSTVWQLHCVCVCTCVLVSTLMNSCHHEQPQRRRKCTPVCQHTADALGGAQLALGVNLRQLYLWKSILRPRIQG